MNQQDIKNIKNITLEELRMHVALGTIPEGLQWTGSTEQKALGTRTCSMCKSKIKKGEEFHNRGGYNHTFNVCMNCSYVSFVVLLKLIK